MKVMNILSLVVYSCLQVWVLSPTSFIFAAVEEVAHIFVTRPLAASSRGDLVCLFAMPAAVVLNLFRADSPARLVAKSIFMAFLLPPKIGQHQRREAVVVYFLDGRVHIDESPHDGVVVMFDS